MTDRKENKSDSDRNTRGRDKDDKNEKRLNFDRAICGTIIDRETRERCYDRVNKEAKDRVDQPKSSRRT